MDSTRFDTKEAIWIAAALRAAAYDFNAKIVEVLHQESKLKVFEIQELIPGATQSKLGGALRRLKKANVVESEPVGPYRIYSLSVEFSHLIALHSLFPGEFSLPC